MSFLSSRIFLFSHRIKNEGKKLSKAPPLETMKHGRVPWSGRVHAAPDRVYENKPCLFRPFMSPQRTPTSTTTARAAMATGAATAATANRLSRYVIFGA